MTGYSLHIGLNYVDPNAYNGWDGELSGCINDANAMMDLAGQAGFVTSQLIDSAATTQAVVGELGRLADVATAGDLCLVTLSGHGGQVDDNNGDEQDSMDETWVLWDRQLCDDELYQMWSQFAPGVRILVFSDSCHSGTVAKQSLALEMRNSVCSQTRSVEEDLQFKTAELSVKPKSMPLDTQSQDNEERRGTYRFVQALAGPKSDADVSAQVILISGCQDNQLSYDGDVNGAFTTAVLETWANGSFRGDYRRFHSDILSRMTPDQTPNLYTVGPVSEAYLGQRPFEIAPPGAGGSSPNPSGPTSGTSTAGRPTVRRGDTGEHVLFLQQRLLAHGYSVSADGIFGPGTENAVRNFQNSQGLVGDGVVGPKTWAALGDAAGPEPEPEPQPEPEPEPDPSDWSGTASRPTIRRGDRGEDVRYLQQRLRAYGYTISADGAFGPATESAVRSFQRSNGLTADGVVGPKTWQALG